ncbi:Ppx/GppA phosphatase family protein [Pilimelia columellifera]|uniref:Ppx/GppA phosphatase family protein n=1 Tax=Pilimelia columellifera TaxID=706574 RepID=UPI0031CE3587
MRVAAIDCGTNSVRLLVADLWPDGRLGELSRQMRIVRLGEGVDRTGRLAPEAIARTRDALAEYAAIIAELGAARVRMCATSASRDADNADDFQRMARDTLGVDPEVISGDDEARLSFAGAVRGLTVTGPCLVVDIGGGSTEFVRGGATVEAAVSIDIGCVRMTERHLRSDPPTPEQARAAHADVVAAVDRALAAVAGPAATLVGLAGSVTTVAAVALGLDAYDSTRIHHTVLTRAAVTRVADDLMAMSVAQRRSIPVMHPGRADVIAAGALVLRVIMERADAATVVVSESDILDGIALSLST